MKRAIGGAEDMPRMAGRMVLLHDANHESGERGVMTILALG